MKINEIKKYIFFAVILIATGCSSESTSLNINRPGENTNNNQANKPKPASIKVSGGSFETYKLFENANIAFAYRGSLASRMKDKQVYKAADTLMLVFANFSSTDPFEFAKDLGVPASSNLDAVKAPFVWLRNSEPAIVIKLGTKKDKLQTGRFSSVSNTPLLEYDSTNAAGIITGSYPEHLNGTIFINEISENRVKGTFDLENGPDKISGTFDIPIYDENGLSNIQKF